MANRWARGMASIGCAAVMTACGGSDDQREDAAIQDRMARAPQQVALTGCVQTGQLETEYVLRNVRTEDQQSREGVSYKPGEQPQPSQQPEQAQPPQQAQRSQQQEPRAGQQAAGQQHEGAGTDPTRLPARPDSRGITPYSFVQLRVENPAELRQYVGQEVRVTGTMTDLGENTIGTSGSAGTHQTPSGDTSAAAAGELSHPEKKAAEAGPIARQSMANGTAPIVRVENITPTGEQCTDMPAPTSPQKK